MVKKIICHDVFGNKKEVSSNKLIFRPSVYGILIEHNKILLSTQWGGYDFPGGGVNNDETIEEALEREFFEETGIKIKIKQPIYCSTSFFHPIYSKKNKNKYWNCLLMYFLCEKIGGKLSKDYLDDEEKKYADMPEWIDLDKINKIKFYNSINSVKLIKKAVEYKTILKL